MPEKMVYEWHHKFLATYTIQNQTILTMNDSGELNNYDPCDSRPTVIVSEQFLTLISKVCPNYVETRTTWFLNNQPPADVGGVRKAVGGEGGGEDVGGRGNDVEGGGGNDVEGGGGKDVGGGGKGVRGKGEREDFGSTGKYVEGGGKNLENELVLFDLDKYVHSGLTLYAIMSMFCSRPDLAAFEAVIRMVVYDKSTDFFVESDVILSSAMTVPQKGEKVKIPGVNLTDGDPFLLLKTKP